MAGTTSYAPNYQDYLNYWKSGDQSAYSESGATNQAPQLSQDAFNALGDEDKWNALGQVQSRETAGKNMIALAPDDPRAKDLIPQTGMEDGRGIAIVHGNESDVHFGDSKFWNDPSKVVNLGGGNYAFAPNNMTPYAQAQGHENTLAGKIIIGLVGSMVGASVLSGAGGAAGSVGEGAGAVAPGMSAQAAAESQLINAGITPGSAEWTSSLAAQGLDTTAGAGAAGGAGAPPAGAPPSEPPPPTDGGAPVSDGATPTPGDGPAPVTNGSTPIPGSSGSSGGLLDGVRNTASNLGSWYNGLSPASRFVLGTAISQGGSAIMRGIATREALQQQRDLTNQQRADIVRRGQVPAFGDSAFTPKPGIINSQRGGGTP